MLRSFTCAKAQRQAKQDITCFEDVVSSCSAIRVMQTRRYLHRKLEEQGCRYLTVLDDGSGIQSICATVFRPFVTSKLDTFHEDRWRLFTAGMALYSIKERR